LRAIERGAIVAGLTIAATLVLVLVLLRPWWAVYAPEALQLPVGWVALALGMGTMLWLPRAPRTKSTRPVRRRRLRDRAPRSEQPKANEDD
jgi:hypothetical protein